MLTSTPAPPASLDGVVHYPESYAQACRAAGYWIGHRIDDVLRDAAREAPDTVAVICESTSWTYAELDGRVDRLASYLLSRGLHRGERVVVQLPNVPEFVRVVFALWRLGVVPVLALPSHRRAEIEYLCRTTEAAGIITCERHRGFDPDDLARELGSALPMLRIVLTATPDASGLPILAGVDSTADLDSTAERLECPASPADVAFLQLSGANSGSPKLIPRTHDDYLYSVRESVGIAGLDSSSVLLLALPVAHNFALSSPGLLGVFHARGTVVLARDASPEEFYQLVERHGVTIAPAMTPMALTWLNSPLRENADTSSLRVLQVGGARLPERVAARVGRELGCTLQQVFGMPEGLVSYTRLTDDEATIVAGSVSPISPADEIRVVDDDDRPVEAGEPGHLLTRGPYTIRGYYRAPEHNTDAFTPEGFFRTGDIVIQRSDGALVFVGRDQDRIVRAGTTIYPQEIEDVLLAHPAIHDLSVVGARDRQLGERVRAHVVLRSGCDDTQAFELRRWLEQEGLPPSKMPDEFVFGPALPKTGAGKIDRRHLRDDGDGETYDIIGVGFGPANLAFAIALEEHNAAAEPGQRLSLLCCEKRGGTQWHPGMLLPDAAMQVSFLKDLATFRNPTSRYSFISFLHSVGRLVDFTNRNETAPLRIEFSTYLKWAAEQLDRFASLATEVLAITPVGEDDRVGGFEVTVRRRGAAQTLRARNVIVSAGLQPRFPARISPGPRVWHSHEHLTHLHQLAVASDIVILGSGQSAIEVALDAYERVPGARVHLVSSQFGIGPSDHGPLVNQIFDPASVDAIYAAPEEVRERLDRLHRGANHGTANPRQLRAFFDLQYRDSWHSIDRLRLHRVSRLESVRTDPAGGPLDIRLVNDLDGRETLISADALICATGYSPFDTTVMLGEHAGVLSLDDYGRPLVDRNCRAQLTVRGVSEKMHQFAEVIPDQDAVVIADPA